MAEALLQEQGSDALSAKALARAFLYATDWLGVYVDEVNALNVYPVPDGDTGTNMHLTLQSVRRQILDENPKTMSSLAHALSYGSLLGARGNSGVILSQILKGFAEVLKRHVSLDAKGLAEALEQARAAAYGAVMKPVEGTILTVARAAAEGAAASTERAPLGRLKSALAAARQALESTPELLPILKQAGVVDAGGLGLVRLLEGLVAAFEGRDLPPPPKVERRAQTEFEEEEFGYCTEFLLSDVAVPTSEIKEVVAPFGDSLLVVGAEGFVKGHIHTEEPEKLLAAVAKFGKMVRSKVEDMSEQHSEILMNLDVREAETPESALVVVSDGYGVTKVFRSLGARVVGGGQTNNPSVEDIADAVRSVAAEKVIVMPNNKNIIMAAERVGDLVSDKEVVVLPTRTLAQGLAAAVRFDERLAPEAQLEGLREAALHARNIEVTTASRSTTIDGVTVTEGQFIGLVDDKLESAGESPEAVLLELLERHADGYEIGTLFYGAGVGQETAEALIEEITERFDDLELELRPGGPDLYPYVLALE